MDEDENRTRSPSSLFWMEIPIDPGRGRRDIVHRRWSLGHSLCRAHPCTGQPRDRGRWASGSRSRFSEADAIAQSRPDLSPSKQADQATPQFAVASGRLSPFIHAKERISDKELLLFGPIDAEDLHSDRLTYQYQAPVRVSNFGFSLDDHRVTVTIDMTLPREVKVEEAARLSRNLTARGATPPTVNVKPLPIQSYVVELIFDESEGVLRLGSSGGEAAIVGPPSSKTFTAVVPDSMPALRNLLSRRDHWKATVRLRATYGFERVAQGSVSLARVGLAVHRVLEEVRPKYANGQVPPEMYLDRQALDNILERIAETIIRTDNNAGLDPDAWASLLAEAKSFVERYFADLPRVSAHEAITSGQDMFLAFTAGSGRVDGQAILSKDKINFKEKSEKYSRKASEDLKVVQEFMRKESLDKTTYKEMRDKLHIDTEAKVGIKLFSAAANLKLDKSSDNITQDDLATMTDDKKYWLNDGKRSEELNTEVYEKVVGEMNLQKSIAKIVNLYHLDERELTSKVETRLTRRLVHGIEGKSLLTETALMEQPSDALALLDKRILTLEKKATLERNSLETELATTRESLANLRADLAAKFESQRRQLEGMAPDVKDLLTRRLEIREIDQVFTFGKTQIPGTPHFGPQGSNPWIAPGTYGNLIKSIQWRIVEPVNAAVASIGTFNPIVHNNNQLKVEASSKADCTMRVRFTIFCQP